MSLNEGNLMAAERHASALDASLSALRKLKRPAHYREESREVFSIPLFDSKSCGSMVEYLKALDDWSTAEVRYETDSREFVTSVRPEVRLARMLDAACTPELCARFDEKMNNVVKPLIKNLLGVSLYEHSGTQIIRYPSGGHYIPHQDAGSDMLYRYFTVVCYLNDDFEGGHTRFPSLAYSAVPKAGTGILFPSNFFHCAEPVIRGEKFVIISWVNGPIPLKWI
jgi:Rps23 Pro-64 3,4-dihydroxylase Tpa1-like proline 4-hydroxylase